MRLTPARRAAQARGIDTKRPKKTTFAVLLKQILTELELTLIQPNGVPVAGQ